VNQPLDLSLYLVADPDATGGRNIVEVVAAAVEGGVTVVQLRGKRLTTSDFVELGRTLRNTLTPRGVPLIINDRVDVALAVGADGVHIGQDDMAVRDVRALVGPALIVGLSVTNELEAQRLDASLVDYAGVGPVFATPSKADAAPPLGLTRLAGICRTLTVPVVAIGGISLGQVESVVAAGARGIAVVSAICGADDPRAAARTLSTSLRTPGSVLMHGEDSLTNQPNREYTRTGRE
jgi:thiamine-phosphate pyrophosphorylase